MSTQIYEIRTYWLLLYSSKFSQHLTFREFEDHEYARGNSHQNKTTKVPTHVIRKHSELQYIKGKHTHTPHMHTDRYAHLHKHTYTTNANRKHTHTDTYEHTYRHAYKPTEGRRVILSYYNYSWTFPVCLDRMKELNSSTLRDW